MTSQLLGPPGPDVDLLEYVLVSAPCLSGLGEVADAAAELIGVGAVRLIDAVVMVRPLDDVEVAVLDPAEHEPLARLADLADKRVVLSTHDIQLASVTLGPGVAALLLLLEDRWAGRLSAAARASGGRLTCGERITRDRVEASLGEGGVQHRGGTDLLSRSPLGGAPPPGGPTPLLDQVAQVRELARLVGRGLLSLAQYDVQRQRVLDG